MAGLDRCNGLGYGVLDGVYIHICLWKFIYGYIRQLGWQMGVPINKMVGPMSNCLVVERWTVCTFV